MRKLLLGVVLLASLSSNAVFAACTLDTMGRTLKTMADSELTGNVIAFKESNTNVTSVLKNIKKDFCSNSDAITIVDKNGLTEVTSVAPGKTYRFYSWSKNGELVSAQLNPDYTIK
ncbi:MAG: hypothetical protein KBD83_00700 [Gammaproteobacteria bacterium]|nr:hypothetical protein [Gammaproteobacteria bacterium]